MNSHRPRAPDPKHTACLQRTIQNTGTTFKWRSKTSRREAELRVQPRSKTNWRTGDRPEYGRTKPVFSWCDKLPHESLPRTEGADRRAWECPMVSHLHRLYLKHLGSNPGLGNRRADLHSVVETTSYYRRTPADCPFTLSGHPYHCFHARDCARCVLPSRADTAGTALGGSSNGRSCRQRADLPRAITPGDRVPEGAPPSGPVETRPDVTQATYPPPV